MQLSRLDVSSRELEELPAMVSEEDRPLVIRVTDADTVTVLAGVCADWSGSWGVWLEASADYSAGLIARDVKTLARLLEIDHVVIDAAAHADQHADVVAALLSDEPVTLANEVANITHAYNRPAPPRPLSVWSVAGDVLRRGEVTLHRSAVRGAVASFTD